MSPHLLSLNQSSFLLQLPPRLPARKITTEEGEIEVKGKRKRRNKGMEEYRGIERSKRTEKGKVEDMKGYRLMCWCIYRADDKTAEEYKLEGGATLHLVLALRGGCA